jgi:hypothetical protein
MKDKKKLVLNKNTTKTLKTQTAVKTGTLYLSAEQGRSSSGGSIAGSIAGSNVTLTTYQPGYSG